MSQPQSTPARILIVEDEAISALALEYCLVDMGHAVTGTIDTGEAAIVLAEQQRPDLVLMDIRLAGDMNGIEAARHIHGKLGIPVIFLTAHTDSQTLDEARQASPFGCIGKPFDEGVLRNRIQAVLYPAQP